MCSWRLDELEDQGYWGLWAGCIPSCRAARCCLGRQILTFPKLWWLSCRVLEAHCRSFPKAQHDDQHLDNVVICLARNRVCGGLAATVQ